MNGSKTTRFTLDFQLQSLPVSGKLTIPVGRPFVELSLPGLTTYSPGCFVDTGAAVSVVSWPLRRYLSWRPIAATSPEFTTWNGHACDFGESTIRLYDRIHRFLSAPLAVVAKFIRTPVPFHNDWFIILGLNFLMDNAAKLEVAGQP